jgi:hypothetical protein
MTLLDTEKIGKKLVKHGYYRNLKNHYHYRRVISTYGIVVEIMFNHFYSGHWYADIKYVIDTHTDVNYRGHTEVFTPEWIDEEVNKIGAVFNFIRL